MAITRYQALLQERADLIAQGETVFKAAEAEARGLTVEEQAADDKREERLQAIRAEMELEKRRQDRQAEVGAGDPPRIALGGNSLSVRYAADGKILDSGGKEIAKNAHGIPKLIPAVNFDPAAFESGRDLSSLKPWGADTGYPFGEYLVAVHRAATGRGTDPRLLYQAAGQGANLEGGADGGFLAQRAVSDMIALRMYGGKILSRVDHRTLTNLNAIELNLVDETSRATGSRHGGVQSYWVDAGTAPTGSRPKFARKEWKPRKLATLGYATDELLADVSMIESTMFDAFVDDQKFMAEDSVVNGLGAGMPLGLLNSPALISVSKETGQAAATIVKENIDKMYARAYPDLIPGMVWLINQDTSPQLDSLSMAVGTGGTPVYLPPGGISEAPFGRLKGLPVIPVEYCATLGTVGDIILVNLGEYLLIDKGEPQQATSMHVAFTTDEMAFRVTSRLDGNLKWLSALTPFKGTATQGPAIALATRS